MKRGANAVRSVQKPEVELVRIRNQLMREINAKENQQNCDSVLMKNVLVIYLYNFRFFRLFTRVTILASDCFELVYYTSFGTTAKVEYSNDMNPKKCQDLCIEEEECSIFSLISPASKQRDPGCELKTKLSSKSSLNANVGTVISGLAKCPSKICVNHLILLKLIFVLPFYSSW